ncbi:NAD(P)/FAD-dependent oxidoreductase [Lentzea sp. NPDC006480]|uniref:flavin-containing monooxygenase n=1 Tax=Lentzea sp. NPDC006480 TaxID=3157176 RepID=UPI0033AEC750
MTVDDWLTRFESALKARDAEVVSALFAPESYWRDLVAFTWNIKTAERREEIADLAKACDVGPSGFRVTEPPVEHDGVTEAWLEFETSVGRGKGHLRLTSEGAYTLLTTLEELKGFEERRPVHASPEQQHEPYVVVIGGGQGGIALGARLRQLGVPAVVLERNDRAGDSWRKRYQTLTLHDPVWYDHLPYVPFPRNWPIFSAKDKIADWLEMYTRVMEIPYWTRSEVTEISYDDGWTVAVDRDGETVLLHPAHVVFATGMAGKPHVPDFPGADEFAGEQHHSSQHPGPDAYAGRKVVIVGSNNSAHDIAAALVEHGADVTMVQRSSTHVIKSETLMDLGFGDLYSERALAAGVTTERADTLFASLPYRVMPSLQLPVQDQVRERDGEFYERLAKAGFEVDWGDDGTGLVMKYLRRGSGYYIDVGASELVVNGSIKLARGQVVRLTRDTVVLDDGRELEADLVVYATGYGSMNGFVADLAGEEMAARVGKVWGIGSDTYRDPGPWEGEQRNMWKPTQQPGLWFHGGNLAQSRYFSLYLALQLKARFEGLETPVYGLQEVHHTS